MQSLLAAKELACLFARVWGYLICTVQHVLVLCQQEPRSHQWKSEFKTTCRNEVVSRPDVHAPPPAKEHLVF